MKNTIKRFISIVLLVCIFASFAVPATFADTAAATVYNFDLAHSSDPKVGGYVWNGVKLNREISRTDGTASGKTGWQLIDGFYADPDCVVNWKLEAFASGAEHSRMDADKGGLYTYIDTTQTSGYLALRLAAPATGAGAYQVTMTSVDPRNTIDVYLLDASKFTTVEEAATNENRIFTGIVGAASVAQTNTTQMPVTVAGGEMILIIYTTNVVAKSRHIISNVTLTPVGGGTQTPTTVPTTEPETTAQTTAPAEPVETEGLYDLEVYNHSRYQPMIGTRESMTFNKFAEGSFADVYNTSKRVKDILAADYPSVLNWKVEGISTAMTYDNLSLYATANNGVRMQKPATATAIAGWIAIRIQVPTAGIYDLSQTTKVSWVTHNVYVFPAEGEQMTAEELEEKMTAANLVGAVGQTDSHSAAEPYTFTHEGVEFSAAGEYIVALKMQENVNKTTIYLSNLALTPVVEPEETTAPVETTQATTEATTEATTAPTEPEDGWAVTENFFDLELYNYGGFPLLAGVNKAYTKRYDDATGISVQNYLATSYPDKVNWVLENATEGAVLQLRGAEKQGLRMELGKENWVAFRLNVTKSGVHRIQIRSSYTGYDYTANVFFFPAPAEKMEREALAAAMIGENLLGTATITAGGLIADLGQQDVTAGEYIILLQAQSRERVYVSSIALLGADAEPPKEPVDKVTYNFDLVGMDKDFPQRGFSNWTDSTKAMKISQKIAQMYDQDQIQWKYEGRSATATAEKITGTYLRFKSTEDYLTLEKAWNAFRLETPGAGVYDVRLTGLEKNSAVINVYLIPAITGVSMTGAEIEAAMVKENLLISGARISGEGTFYLGEYTFGKNYEYVMVLEFTRGTRLNLSKVEMTKDGLVADSELPVGKTYNGTVYNLDLADPFEGFLYKEKRYYLPDVYTQVQSRWSAGLQNWKFEAFSEDFMGATTATGNMPNTEIRFYQSTGLRMYGEKGSWVALRIKSPGNGTFTVSLNHGVCPSSGTVAFYVIPSDTPEEEIFNATDPDNRIGTVTLTNESGIGDVVDGETSFVGYYDFEAGKEYILVIECYENSRFVGGMCYMNMSQIVMERGKIDYKTEQQKVITPMTVAENIMSVADSGNGHVAVFEMNGHDYYLVQLEGGNLYLYNMDTKELEDFHYIPGNRPRTMSVAPDGKVWLTNSWKYMVCYDPTSFTYEKSPLFMPEYKHNGFGHMTFDENGILYANLDQSSHIIQYDPATREYTDLGYIYNERDDTGDIVYQDGYLYLECMLTDQYNYIVKYSIETGKIVGMFDLFPMCGNNSGVISFLGDELLAIAATPQYDDYSIIINKNTMEMVDIGLPGPVSMYVSEVLDGKQYIVSTKYGLYEFDLATQMASKVTGFQTMSGTGFRSGGQRSYGKAWATLDGDLCLITSNSGGSVCPRVINLVTKEYYEWRDLTRDATGGGSEIISLTNCEPGENEIAIGFWNAKFVATFDIDEGVVTNVVDSAGQTDSIAYYKGILYGGCYSATVLAELDRKTNTITQRFKLDHEITKQKRLLSMETGGDYVFVGSVPDTGYNGGALTVYNTLTGQWYYERNIVQDQSIVDEAYHDDLIFLASSRSGGDNAPQAGESAVIVAYDYLNRKTLGILDPRDYIPGLASPVDYIYGLTTDPNAEENGRIWAVVSNTLFCFTFDKETCKFNVQIVLSYSVDSYNNKAGVSRAQTKIDFLMEENQIYVVFKDFGARCVVLEDWNAPIGKVKVTSDERFMAYSPKDFIIAEDNNLYFGSSGSLLMMPLNVTEEDWVIAGQLDAQILALDRKLTLEDEAEVRAVQSAYDNSSWYYKSLVQNLEILREAESDILECVIEKALTDTEVTADDYPALQELVDAYKALDARQQRYVKNYKELKANYDLASDLNDQRLAEAMQKRIDALEGKFPMTLENEPEVVAIRTDFDALRGSQQILVDITLLEKAEDQIAALRAEFVLYVESLIQAIPEVITLEAEPAITAAREGVDKLYALERKQISYAKLETAEGKLRGLLKSKTAAEEVDTLISAIGIVTLGDAERIAQARAAYNRLDESGRLFCTKLGKLQRAEFILKVLQSWGIPTIVVVVAGAGFAAYKLTKRKKKDEA